MKRISIALAALGLSISSFAAMPAATDPTLIVVPQLPGGFVIGGMVGYLQPSDTHGDLDYASANTGTTSPFASSLRNVEPGYDWAWGLNIGYIFPNTGNDINLSWFTFSTDDTNSVFSPTETILPLNFNSVDLINNVNYASAKAEYDLDQVDLTVGQFIDVGCRLILHPNVGLRWSEVERKLTSHYQEIPAFNPDGDSDFMNVNEDSDFSGIGPIVGLDASYYIGMGFGAVAHVDSAVLVGNIDSHTNPVEFEEPANTPTYWTLNADNSQRVVPVVDAKLGLDYTYVFNNAANTDLTLEAGWMFSNYFNAVDRIGGTGDGVGDASAITRRITSDVGLEGPYVSVQLHV